MRHGSESGVQTVPNLECMDCGFIGREDQLQLVFDDPEYGVIAGYICRDIEACESRQGDAE